ncbi:hypothetical protein WAI453_007199 [Rhynchosporium graminicola]
MPDHIPLNQISKGLLGLNEVLELFVVSFSAHLCLMNIQFTKMLTGKGDAPPIFWNHVSCMFGNDACG